MQADRDVEISVHACRPGAFVVVIAKVAFIRLGCKSPVRHRLGSWWCT